MLSYKITPFIKGGVCDANGGFKDLTMHEFSIMEKLFKIILQEAKNNDLQQISKVYLQIGELRQIMPDFLQFAFAQIAKNTVAAGAELLIEPIDGKDIILESLEGEQVDENND